MRGPTWGTHRRSRLGAGATPEESDLIDRAQAAAGTARMMSRSSMRSKRPGGSSRT